MLEQLQNNLEQLIAAYEAQRERADRLEAEVEKYKKAGEVADNRIKELEDKVDNLSLRSVFVPVAGAGNDARAKIDSLIEEIDKALAMLQ